MQNATRAAGLALTLLVSSLLAGCAGLAADAPTTKNPKVVVTVKFKSRFDDAEVQRRYPERMPEFRKLPGLVQKYYLYDRKAGEWSGIYFWDSMAAVQEYMQSDLKKSIPEAYGVVGTPRGEVFELVDTLR